MTDNTASILFCGDFAPIATKPEIGIFNEFKKIIKTSDLSYLNLESPLGQGTYPIKKNGLNLSLDHNWIRVIEGGGFSLIGLANNHIMDQGAEALIATISQIERFQLNHIGAGINLFEAQKPQLLSVNGLRIALIAIAEHEFSIASNNIPGVAPLDEIDNFYQIRNALTISDHVIIVLHAGNEYFPLPRPGLRKICRFFIDLGASSVICHHNHIPSAYEIYKDSFISYGLGNLFFTPMKNTEKWDSGYSVKLIFQKNKKMNFKLYYHSFGANNINVEKDKNHVRDFVETKNDILSNPEEYKVHWSNYIRQKEYGMLYTAFFPFTFRKSEFLFRFLKLDKLTIPKKSILRKINVINCESHLELLREILNKREERS